MRKLPHGEIFAVPLPDGTYICGRVLLDIYGTLKKRLFPADSLLPGLGQAYLVEMYSAIQTSPEYTPSPVLIPGAFLESNAVGSVWPVVGRKIVNPYGVEFPESLNCFSHSKGNAAFQCGEISVPLPLTEKEVLQQIDVLRIRHSAFLWPFTCLRVLGRESEVPINYKTASLTRADLRLSPHRKSIYEHLPFPMEMSYYQKQKMLGLDFDRLYE